MFKIAVNQPLTPIIDSVRALLPNEPGGNIDWIAFYGGDA
jgi:hypothetical protein